jgi:hypothetical protein
MMGNFRTTLEASSAAVLSREGLFMARSGQGANFRFGQEHRTFLSVNEFHYLTQPGHSTEWIDKGSRHTIVATISS